MKHAVETESGGMIYILNFIQTVKIMKFRHSKLLQKKNTHTQAHKGYLIRLILFF
jgi:hypothetical protein